MGLTRSAARQHHDERHHESPSCGKFEPTLRKMHVSGVGTVKSWPPKGLYGFIVPDGGGADLFVHKSALRESFINELKKGARVAYELYRHASGSNSGKVCAREIRLLA